MSDVRTLLKKRPLLFDGGMGTYYKGAPAGNVSRQTGWTGGHPGGPPRLSGGGSRCHQDEYLRPAPHGRAAQNPEWEALADAGWKLAAEAAAGTDAAVFADLGPAPDTEGLSAAQVYTAVVRRVCRPGGKELPVRDPEQRHRCSGCRARSA